MWSTISRADIKAGELERGAVEKEVAGKGVGVSCLGVFSSYCVPSLVTLGFRAEAVPGIKKQTV